MPEVVFVVPYALEASLRFVRAAQRLPGVRLGLITQDEPDRLPEDVRRGLAAHARVGDAQDASQLVQGVRSIARQFGGGGGSGGGNVDRLIAILEQLQVPLAQAREHLGIPGMSVECARNFRDKSRMKDVLRARDLPCARHRLAHDAGEALAFADESGFPLVVKPPAGAGARNTFRVDSRAELEGYLRTAPPSAAAPVLLEEFITGKEHSFDTVTLNGVHVFHSISRYDPAPLEVLRTPWIQWCVLLPRRIDGPEYEDILAAGRRALDVLGMRTGLTHMEWFRRDDGSIAISEVAARPPGAQFTTLLSYAHDLDFYSAWTRLMAFDAFDPPERRYSAGAAYLRGQGQGKIVGVRGIEQAQRELGELIVEARLPKVGAPPAATYEGDGYVVLRHPQTEVVERGLQRLVELIRVDLG
jgi:biotin carboxylase